jgi:chromosomal replication initiation ATPase DnaA
MSVEASNQHTEVLFNEINKLIKKVGLSKAVLQLKAINKSQKKMVGDLATYEFIIRSVIQSFGITETQLYDDKSKFTATDARRTSYYLIKKYLRYSSESIAMQFNKGSSTIREAVIELETMIQDGDRFGNKEYLEKHRKSEAKVIEFIENEERAKNKKN